jgi:HSP20 family protein
VLGVKKKEVTGMEPVPWKPLGELTSFRREMDRLWDRFFGDRPLAKLFEREWGPSVDISETKDNVVVKADLPGLEAKDVDVSVSGDMVTIKGEKAKEEEERGEHDYSCERYFGAFQRSCRLPMNVQVDKAKATFDKGVLKITLPKSEEARKKKIEIKVE